MGNKSSASLLRVRHFSNFLCNFCMYCWIIYLHMVHLLWSRRLTSLLGSKETCFLSRRQKTRCDKPQFKLAKTKAIQKKQRTFTTRYLDMKDIDTYTLKIQLSYRPLFLINSFPLPVSLVHISFVSVFKETSCKLLFAVNPCDSR